MTLSWPSFLAAATSAAIPPMSATLVAVAALLELDDFLAGGLHAVTAAASAIAARRPQPRTTEFRTGPPSGRSGAGPALGFEILVRHGRDQRMRHHAPRSARTAACEDRSRKPIGPAQRAD